MDVLLLRVPEAAAQLGISRAKLYELIANDVVPSVRLGGCRRIRSDDLRDFVAHLAPLADPGINPTPAPSGQLSTGAPGHLPSTGR